MIRLMRVNERTKRDYSSREADLEARYRDDYFVGIVKRESGVRSRFVDKSMTHADVRARRYRAIEKFQSLVHYAGATHFSVHGNENVAPGLDFNSALRDKARMRRAQSMRERARLPFPTLITRSSLRSRHNEMYNVMTVVCMCMQAPIM